MNKIVYIILVYNIYKVKKRGQMYAEFKESLESAMGSSNGCYRIRKLLG
jgi:hypothetical protein